MIRDKTAIEKKMTELSDRFNVYILHADLISYASLKQVVVNTVKIVDERDINYLIVNEAFSFLFNVYDSIDAL